MAKTAAPGSPEAYIASLPEKRREAVAELDAFIRKTAPKLKPFILAGMLGYGPFHYVYASGREGDWAVVSLCSRAQHLSLYLCAVDEQGYLAEQAKARLPKADIGKSCIRFKKLEDIDLKVIAELLKKSQKWAEQQAKQSSQEKRAAVKKSLRTTSRSEIRKKAQF